MPQMMEIDFDVHKAVEAERRAWMRRCHYLIGAASMQSGRAAVGPGQHPRAALATEDRGTARLERQNIT